MATAASALPHSPKRFWVEAFLVVALHAVFGLIYAALASVDIDEAYTLHTTSHNLARTVDLALHFELQAPLYFALLKAWRVAHDGVFWARTFSVLCTSSAILFATRAAWLFRGRTAVAVPLWLALNPLLIWAAMTVRGYALTIAWSSLLLMLWLEIFQREDKPTRTELIAYFVASTLALASHYYLGFILFGNGLATLATRGVRRFITYTLAMIPVAFCIAPLVIAAQSQVTGYSVPEPSPLIENLQGMTRITQNLIWNFDLVSWGPLIRWPLRIILFGCFIAAVVFRTKDRDSARIAVGLIIATVVPAFILCVVRAYLGGEYVQIRHITLILIPATLTVLSILAMSDLRPRFGWANPLLVVSMLITASLSANAMLTQYGEGEKVVRNGPLVQSIEKQAVPGEPIFTFPSDGIIALQYHARDPRRLHGLPSEPSFTIYDPRRFAFTDTTPLIEHMDRILGSSETCWLVTYTESNTLFGVNLHPEILEQVIRDHFVTLSTDRWREATIRKLERRRD